MSGRRSGPCRMSPDPSRLETPSGRRETDQDENDRGDHSLLDGGRIKTCCNNCTCHIPPATTPTSSADPDTPGLILTLKPLRARSRNTDAPRAMPARPHRVAMSSVAATCPLRSSIWGSHLSSRFADCSVDCCPSVIPLSGCTRIDQEQYILETPVVTRLREQPRAGNL